METQQQHTLQELFPELLATLLVARGISTTHEAHAFLSPEYDRDLHDPFLLPDMEKAVERILAAIEGGERIAVYSDFDCDGIPGAVVMHEFFARIGYENVEVYIPHRNRDGFGFHVHAVEELAERGASLIVTVDCGIAGVAATARATELNVDVIITDHHVGEGALPAALAIVNPNVPGSTYPNSALCGAGVAFQLVRATLARGDFGIVPGWEKWLLDMVALATVADMVSLREPENRALATYGLMVLRKSRRPGLQQLLRTARVDQRTLSEDDIGFVIAPRINAASRMDAPEDAFRLLATHDESEAGTLVRHLESLNRKRKTRVGLIVKEAKARLQSRADVGAVIVLGNPEWPPSLLGLAANSLAEEYRRPAFLWGRTDNGALKGSCRSDGVTNLVALMREASEAVVEYGGHAFAGGFELSLAQVGGLESALCNAYTTVREGSEESTVLEDTTTQRLDAPSTFDRELFKLLEQLSPFGVGNPRPIFSLTATVREYRSFGKGDLHAKIILEEYSLPVIAFFAAKFEGIQGLQKGDPFRYAVSLESSSFAGRTELRLRVV